jgi:hypothetical protein
VLPLSVALLPANEIECKLQQQSHAILWSLWGGFKNVSSASRSCQQFSNTWEKERVIRFWQNWTLYCCWLISHAMSFFPSNQCATLDFWCVSLSLWLSSSHCRLQIFQINWFGMQIASRFHLDDRDSSGFWLELKTTVIYKTFELLLLISWIIN